jgi:uncharacterized RDD family membrane protein YckC
MSNPPLADMFSRSAPPDPVTAAYYYQGITAKRLFAYFIDVVLIVILEVVAWLVMGIAGFVTFFLAWALIPLVMVLIPMAYHFLQIAGPQAATFGQRMMGIGVVSTAGARKPTLLQALVLTLLFYATVPTTGFLVLLFMFFNPYRRALHDYLSGTIVLNRVPESPS